MENTMEQNEKRLVAALREKLPARKDPLVRAAIKVHIHLIREVRLVLWAQKRGIQLM